MSSMQIGIIVTVCVIVFNFLVFSSIPLFIKKFVNSKKEVKS